MRRWGPALALGLLAATAALPRAGGEPEISEAQLRAMGDEVRGESAAPPPPGARAPLVLPWLIAPPVWIVPATGECIDVVCRKVGRLACDDEREVLEIARLCVAQASGECIDAACERLGPLGCTTLREIAVVAAPCGSQLGGACLRTSCELAGALACDSPGEVTAALTACSGNFDGRCVHVVCARLGRLRCDSLDEVTRVARVCGGALP